RLVSGRVLEAIRCEWSLVDRVARKDRDAATHVIERGFKQRLGSGLRLRAHVILPPSLKNKRVQILVLFRSRLAPVHGARRHVVDEFVMLAGEPLLLALGVKRDFGPFERPVGVAKRTGAVLLGLRRFHPLGVADGAGVFDLAADLLLLLLLVVLAQAAAVCVLDVIGERMKAIAVGLQQARDG